MFIVVWTTNFNDDYWEACETKEQAQRLYDKVVATENTFTASITAVLVSTDYEPAAL